MENRKYYESQSRIIKALAHPTRLFMVDKLSDTPLCVCELTELVGDDISTVSRHLLTLKKAGIISSEKVGLKVIYHLEMKCIMKFVKCIEAVSNNKNCEKCIF